MANLLITEDTYISEYYSDLNYGSDQSLSLYNRSGYQQWILIKFPSITNPYMIKSLNLYCSTLPGSTITTINIHKITSNWDENTVTWRTKPSYEATPFISLPANIVKLNQYSSFDIGRMSSDLPYGIIIIPNYGTSSTTTGRFNSSENASNKPYIVAIADISFQDPVDSMPFADDKGNQGKQLDFSQIVAGNTSDIKAIDLYNYNGFSVSNPIVWLENITIGDTVEISKTNNPFIPSPEVHFDGTFASGSKVGTFYVRVKSSENSTGSKSFRIKAKATPV